MANQTTNRMKGSAIPLNPLSMTSGNPLLFAARLQAKAMKATLEWQMEAMEFFQHRYLQDIKLVDGLADCREPGEVISTCSAFLQDAMDDYSREAVKAASHGTRFATDTAKDIRHEAETFGEDLKTAAATAA